MSLNIIYYSGFWYSAHMPIVENSFELLTNQKNKAKRIKDDMRLLSLVFEQIHVPRSHLLTFQNSSHWNIIQSYLSTKDYEYFSGELILLASRLPFSDNISDTERVADRVFVNNWAEGIDSSYLNTIKQLESAKIHSIDESKRNVDDFQQYIELLKCENKRLGNSIDEIKKKSSYLDIPFLHEIFIEELLDCKDIDKNEKIRIWRETNSMYMLTGGMDLGDNRRISYDNSIESNTALHDNSGFLRTLYSPKFIEALIIEELGLSYLRKFLELNIRDVFPFRNENNSLNAKWKNFQLELSEMFNCITLLAKYQPSFSSYSEQQIIKFYKNYLLQSDGNTSSDILADIMVSVGGEIDPLLGKSVKSGKKVIASRISKWFADRKLSKTIGEYQEFWKEYKAFLDKI